MTRTTMKIYSVSPFQAKPARALMTQGCVHELTGYKADSTA